MIRTFFLILLLVGAVIVLLLLSVNTDQREPQVTATPSPAQAVLTLSETISTTAARSVNVNIDSGTSNVTGVQLEIAYDPNILTNVDIEPGTFFENPVALLEEINREEGRISYALAVSPAQGGVYGAGTVAMLTFNTASESGQTRIEFLPKTVVSGEGVAESILKTTTGLTLDL